MHTQRKTLIAAILVTIFTLIAYSGNIEGSASAAIPAPTPAKVMSEYRGVPIGMSTDAVRAKLGKPKDTSDEMDMYLFGDNESVQYYYDGARAVKAMLITFSGDLKTAPMPKDVFGEDAVAKADGSIFKMVRYEKAGYWISYNRIVGSDQVVTIAIQKI